MIKLKDIIRASGLHPKRIFNVYIFGSRIYGTYDNKSDWDIIMVANNSVESTEVRNGLYNIHIYTPDKFKADLEWHRINNLECIYAPEWAKLKEDINYTLKVDNKKIRHAISHISSNSWVKCKKKLNVANEYKIGVKSLFHSIRIPMFGTQIMKYGEIKDFTCANNIWYEIRNKRWTWEELNKKFKPLYNKQLTEFRKYAPK